MKSGKFLLLIWCFIFSAVSYAADKHRATGIVNSVDKQTNTLSIHHDPIESMGMSAMTMDFYVKSVGMLSQVREGQKVIFILALDDFGRLIIEQIEVVDD